MECNKDEAVRAREIAERKFNEKDYAGARKFASKAQNLFPQLDGISQLLETFDVYAAAGKKTSIGEVDWYSVLGVNPFADEETIKKHYRKRVLMLHPDKNKSVGADGAFQLVSAAWSLLSDKGRRLAYNEKLNVMLGSQQRVSTQTKVTLTPTTANGFHNINSTINADSRAHKKTTRTTPASGPSLSHQKQDTFWTICNKCKTQYEYLRIYLNHTLLCPNCHEAFFAVEKAAPPNVTKSSSYSSRQKHQNSKHRAANSNMGTNFTQSSGTETFRVNSSSNSDLEWNHFSRTAGSGGSFPSSSAPYHQGKREHDEIKAAADWSTGNSVLGAEELFKRRRSDENYMNRYGADMVNGRAGLGNASEQRRGYFDTQRVHGFSSISAKLNIKRELSPLEVRNMLMEKARLDICKRLGELRSNQMKLKESKKQKTVVRKETSNHKKHDNSSFTTYEHRSKRSFPEFSADDSTEKISAPMTINVPDPDFHNFDLDRSEHAFADDQVWAAYDGDDGMPRYYARIQKVISLKPFKMKISWLNSRTNREFSSVDWVGYGFPKTCGDFRAGRYEMSKTLNSFSHKVKWTKGGRGAIRILPGKGDVWALYKNWSADWDEHTPDEVVHQYEMVEVLDDYNEEQGVPVVPLVKVAGFKTVFHRNMDPDKIRRIPKEEMIRFSHQVPDYLLTGEEAHNAPKGCRELDPAATPLELLQVITEASETQTTETIGKTAKDERVNSTQTTETIGKTVEDERVNSTETKVNETPKNTLNAKEDERGSEGSLIRLGT